MNGFHLQKTGFTQKPVPLGPVCTIVPSVYYLQWVIHEKMLRPHLVWKTEKKRRKHLTHAQKLPSILSEKRTVEVPLGPKIVLSSHFMDSLRLIPKLLSWEWLYSLRKGSLLQVTTCMNWIDVVFLLDCLSWRVVFNTLNKISLLLLT